MGQSAGAHRPAQCPLASTLKLRFSRNSKKSISKLEMARLLVIISLASVALAQDRYWGSYSSSYPAGGGGDSGSVAESRANFEWAQFGSSTAPRPALPQRASTPRRALAPSRVAAPRATPAPRAPVVPRVVEKSIYSTEEVEPGQYVHNPEWDLTPYQLWKRKQAAKKGLQQPSTNSLPEPARKVVTVRKQKPRAQQPQRAAYQQQQPAYQQQQQAYQQPQQVAAYPRAQHQTYTPEYIFEANNNAQRIYAYTADKYQAKAEGESYSYAAIY